MNFKVLIITLLLPFSALAKEELKIFTYGSFNSDWGPGPNIEKEFESICNCDLIWNTADSSGALLSRVKLTNNKEGYDILLGLDDSLVDEAKKNDLNANEMDAAVRMIAGTARSMGIEVE